jgi:hypothetical protein
MLPTMLLRLARQVPLDDGTKHKVRVAPETPWDQLPDLALGHGVARAFSRCQYDVAKDGLKLRS